MNSLYLLIAVMIVFLVVSYYILFHDARPLHEEAEEIWFNSNYPPKEGVAVLGWWEPAVTYGAASNFQACFYKGGRWYIFYADLSVYCRLIEPNYWKYVRPLEPFKQTGTGRCLID